TATSASTTATGVSCRTCSSASACPSSSPAPPPPSSARAALFPIIRFKEEDPHAQAIAILGPGVVRLRRHSIRATYANRRNHRASGGPRQGDGEGARGHGAALQWPVHGDAGGRGGDRAVHDDVGRGGHARASRQPR